VKTRRFKKCVLMVSGMRCIGCRLKISEMLESVTGVIDVDVNYFRACATIIHDERCDRTELEQRVLKAGYEVDPCVNVRGNGFKGN